MPGTTSKYGIEYPVGTDPVADADQTIKAAADRLDLLLGESGVTTITPTAADTTTTLRVNYSRSYAALAPLVPRATAHVNESYAVATVVNVWTTAEDATGFTLNIRSSGTAARSVKWKAST